MSRYIVTNKVLLELKLYRNMHTFRVTCVIESSCCLIFKIIVIEP